MDAPMDVSHEKVTVELSAAEALVLFDLLARWGDTNAMSVTLEHPSEQRLLWDILATLESALAEPFMPDYSDRVRAARKQIQDDRE